MQRCQYRLGTWPRLTDGGRQPHRPLGHLQEILRQSVTVPRQSGHLQETPTRCLTVSNTVEAPAGDSQTVCGGVKTVWAIAGDSQTVPDSLPDRRAPAVTTRQSATVPIPSGRLQETLRRCKTVSQRVGAPAGDSVCNGAKTVLALARVSQTVTDSHQDSRGTCR
ncbi:hypothetical protein DPMN_193644 [Dreissena polymorpha]|uniref:Uncharacterized protein n=1 Tax=Dreissena polymorpha TaxID=45954 RepID=A0A9D4BEQ1_DREPO|nr:hypothetical protein DPMN_193638 [Dreissena polymorpha]KAH3691044.1 hypothetical protein DPMN_193644 [Dreissena polymorpha]